MSEIVAASEAAALGGMAGVEPAFTALNTLIINHPNMAKRISVRPTFGLHASFLYADPKPS